MKKSMFIKGICALMVVPMFMITESMAQQDQRQQDGKPRSEQPTQRQTEDSEWRTYRNSTQTRITENENRISQFRNQKMQPGQVMDPSRAAKIDALHSRNVELRSRLDKYDREPSDWSNFKREFDGDMNQFGKDLDGMGPNKKN